MFLLFLLFVSIVFSSWRSLRRDEFFGYLDTRLNTSEKESLINLTNRWIYFLVERDEPNLIPQNFDEIHHILYEDTNDGKIFHESCFLRNNFTRSKEKSSTTKNVKTISKLPHEGEIY